MKGCLRKRIRPGFNLLKGDCTRELTVTYIPYLIVVDPSGQ